MFCSVVRTSTTQMRRSPKYAQIWASPIARFPELDSTTVDLPGTSSPEWIRPSTMLSAERSLMLPPGLNRSAFA